MQQLQWRENFQKLHQASTDLLLVLVWLLAFMNSTSQPEHLVVALQS
jgi:hypothetical protein